MNAMNETISQIGVVPVIKLSDPEWDAVPLAKALCAGGVPVAEVTFRAAGAAARNANRSVMKALIIRYPHFPDP